MVGESKMKPTMIELMCGSGKMAHAFREMNYHTLTIDLDEKCEPDLVMDINEILCDDIPEKFRNPDVIWFGMDCTYFSRANTHNGGHIGPNGQIKTRQARYAVETLKNGLRLIEALNPKFWFVENPGGNGAMKSLDCMKKYPHVEIVYCAYGGNTKKPTSLFGKFPSKFIPKTVCHHNFHSENIQNTMKGKLKRSEYPLEFCWDISYACYMSETSSWTKLDVF